MGAPDATAPNFFLKACLDFAPTKIFINLFLGFTSKTQSFGMFLIQSTMHLKKTTENTIFFQRFSKITAHIKNLKPFKISYKIDSFHQFATQLFAPTILNP